MNGDHRGRMFEKPTETAVSRIVIVLGTLSFIAYLANSFAVTGFVARVRYLAEKFVL